MAQPLANAPATHEQRLSMSYEEFRERAGEDTHAEWVKGEVIIFMPPKTIHQRILFWLSTLIASYAQHFNLGEVVVAPFEMRLWPGRSSREPDILFVARHHQERLSPERLEGPADLVVELISESSVLRDRDDKFYEYQEAGVTEYWIVDPRPGKQRADFYTLEADGKYRASLTDSRGRYHPKILPGFWLDPNWFWLEPLPEPILLLAQIAPQILRTALGATEVDDAAP